jgi:amino acid adenylation domain-containing protein
LAGAAPALQLPVNDVRFRSTFPRGDYSWSLDDIQPPAGLAEAERLAVTDLFNAAFTLLLHRYSGQGDIVLWRAGGTGADGERVCRLCPVRSTTADEISFATMAASLAAQYRARADQAVVPPGQELTHLGAGLRAGFVTTDGGSCRPDGVNDIDLLMEVTRERGRAHFTIHYDRGLFEPDFISRMAANYQALLFDACRLPAVPVRELTVVSEEERRYLLDEVNATDRDFPRDASLHSLVEAQVERTPHAAAVEWRGECMTYGELNESANRLARALLTGGIAPGARIGVSVARSHRTICLLLAIHKTGCAYVPLDPEYPADRLSGIAATADMSAVVLDDHVTPQWLADLDATALFLPELWDKAANERSDNLDVAVEATDPTHLIYTSGSTGLPKGVVIDHRNVVALLAWSWDTYSRDDVARTLFGTSLNFDLSVFEIWCPLTLGGCVVVVDNVLALTDGDDLNASLINTVPSALNVLLQRKAIPASTTVLNVAGEPLARELVNAAFADTSVERLYNLYGPSEDTTYSTYKCFRGPTVDNPTIGVPIDNTRVHLLDGAGQLVPRGVVGEIHLGGEGLSSGYINDPARTNAVFVEAPVQLRPTRTLYRTGDLAKWTEAGELQFMGRRDDQVKVRGYRIELGEIESVLRQVVGLADVAALAVRKDDDTRLVCYAGVDGGEVTSARLSDHLQRKLPHYMQPSKIIIEPRLPRLPNGKVDRKALAAREVEWGVKAGNAQQILDADEAAIAQEWSELLGLAEANRDLDFFSVGGHSLLANLLAARLTERCATSVRVAEIYENRTLAQQARLIRTKREQAPTAATGGDAASRIAAVFETLHESGRGHGVPGAAVAVYVDGRLEFAYHGFDDLDEKRPRTAASRQRMTCVTKVLVAYVALILVDRGLVSLDEPLSGLLPDAFTRRPDRTVNVTLRQLLAHTSGIDDSYEVWNGSDLPDLESYVGAFGQYSQLFEPGEVFAYSACGISIVALLIEKLLDMPWRRAVNNFLLTPLGIKEIPESRLATDYYADTMAMGYRWNEVTQRYKGFVPGPQTIADDATSSFLVGFTIEELAVLATFALGDGVTPDGERLLSAELAEQMRTPQIDIPGHHFMHAWGLGWLMFGPSAFGFNSNGSGHHNFIQIFPEQGAFLLLLANAYPAFGLYEDLLQSLTGERLIRTGRPFEMNLADCVGRYESDGYRLNVLSGPERLQYEYFERKSDSEWLQLDEGDLVSSGAGGFSSISEKNILAGSISFVPPPGSNIPGFVRMGQRLARRVR